MKIAMALIGFSAIMLVAACNKQPEETATPITGSSDSQAYPSVQPSPETPPVTVVKTCNVEKVDSQDFKAAAPMVKAGSTVRLSGWIIDERDASVPGAASVKLVGLNESKSLERPIVMWRDRSDVAKARNSEAYLKSGFSVDFDLEGLPSGEYSIFLMSMNRHGISRCDVGRHLVIM